jgi:hypothetical protein
MLYRSATMQLSLKLLNSKPVGPLCNHSKVREECMPDVPFGSIGKIGGGGATAASVAGPQRLAS